MDIFLEITVEYTHDEVVAEVGGILGIGPEIRHLWVEVVVHVEIFYDFACLEVGIHTLQLDIVVSLLYKIIFVVMT